MERAVERLAELQAKLTSLQEAVEQLKQHITRLAEFDYLQSGGDLDDTATNELSTEIIQLIQEQEDDLDLLQEEILGLRPLKALKHDKDRLEDAAERLGEELKSCRPLLRKAQIQAQDNLKQAQKRERELLWASFSQPRSSKTSGQTSPTAADNNNNHHYRPRARAKTALRSEMSKDDQTVASSSDVTAALRRTHDMMASELSRSDFARRTLQESTQALAQLGESYSSLDAMLASSRDLLGTLLTSQKSDTWYLQTSFYMLAATNCWLVFRRLLYGPLWWLVWLPLRLLFRGTVAVTSLAGSGSGQDEVIAAVPLEGKIEASMNNEGIHTVQVGGQPQMAAPEEEEMVVDPGNDESMVEEIGRMIDEAREGKQEVVMDEQVMYEAMEAQEFAQEAEPIEQEAERVRVEL